MSSDFNDNLNNDDLDGIFDNLNPSDFAEPQHEGVEAFDSFVREMVRAVQFAYLSAEGLISPVAILANPEEIEMIPAEDGETLNQYIERLTAEADDMGATWLFVSRLTEVSHRMVAYQEGKSHDATDAVAVQEEREAGRLTEGLFYYAERFEDDVKDARHGILKVEGDRLGHPVEGSSFQPVTLFQNILS